MTPRLMTPICLCALTPGSLSEQHHRSRRRGFSSGVTRCARHAEAKTALPLPHCTDKRRIMCKNSGCEKSIFRRNQPGEIGGHLFHGQRSLCKKRDRQDCGAVYLARCALGLRSERNSVFPGAGPENRARHLDSNLQRLVFCRLFRVAAVPAGASDPECDFAGRRGSEAEGPRDRSQCQRDLHYRQSSPGQSHCLRQSRVRAHHRLSGPGGARAQPPPAAGQRPRAAGATHRPRRAQGRTALPRRATQLPQGRQHVLERFEYRPGPERCRNRDPLYRRA